jgi:hypothetical protein
MECSGLIKLTADGGALFAGHATFNMMSYMLRVFKHYTYNIRSFPTAAQTVSFSSRPADLESKVTLRSVSGLLHTTLMRAVLPLWATGRLLSARQRAGSAGDVPGSVQQEPLRASHPAIGALLGARQRRQPPGKHR